MNGATKAAFLCVVFLGMGAVTIANTQTQPARPKSAAAASRSPSGVGEVIADEHTPRNANSESGASEEDLVFEPVGACCLDGGAYCQVLPGPFCESVGTFMGDGSGCDPRDCNGTGFPDACEIVAGFSEDCNGNRVPDECDVVSGASDDCQADGIPDECQIGKGGSRARTLLWDNGWPAHANQHYYVMPSQVGGEIDDALVVDDFYLSEGSTINNFRAFFEIAPALQWSERVRIEIYPDDGTGTPDESGGPTELVWVPTDGGVVTPTFDVMSLFGDKYIIDVSGLDIELDAGVWWIGIALEGEGLGMWGGGWSTSRGGDAVVMSQAHMRCSAWGFPSFVPSSTVWPVFAWDVAFKIESGIPDNDCNENLIPDECDILDCDGSAWCLDCNANGVPDGCESDCNANGIQDDCDISAGTSGDYDLNGIPDECDPDCNGNGIPDACDVDCQSGNCSQHPLGCGASLDCQPDGMPDECRMHGEFEYHTDDGTQENSIGLSGGYVCWLNQFTVADDYKFVTAVSLAWGEIPDGTPTTVYVWSDPNGDRNPSDARVLASAETVSVGSGTGALIDVDIPDVYVGPVGTTFFVGAMVQYESGLRPCAMDKTSPRRKSWLLGDGEGAIDPNHLGDVEVEPMLVDSLSSGNWMIRAAGARNNDWNENLIPDACDIAADPSLDCNGNTVIDGYEWVDCDGNGAFDGCDIVNCDGSLWCGDCNDNGVPDACDIANGAADCQQNGIPDVCEADCNGNGIPDDCDLLGDLNDDGSVDYDDYVMFLSAFGGRVDGDPAYDACCDYDESGAVGLGDYNIWLAGYRDFIGDPLAGLPSAPSTPQPGLSSQDAVRKKQKPSAEPTLRRLR